MERIFGFACPTTICLRKKSLISFKDKPKKMEFLNFIKDVNIIKKQSSLKNNIKSRKDRADKENKKF